MNILIAGGAGFIGSHIAGSLIFNGHNVTIVDGMMQQTSGSPANLAHLGPCRLLADPVETCPELPDILRSANLVIDCMGWTRHLLALENPDYDLQLNVGSHLSLIRAVTRSPCRKILYLGSRGQFGNVESPIIDDDAPRMPVDVQGIHKTAAESHYRVFARRNGAKVVSLIIGNTFGERMPMDGPDIGLFGGFVRDVLAGSPIQLYGKGRLREFTYAPDLAECVLRLCHHDWDDFQSLNIPGTTIELEELVKLMISLAGSGTYSIEEWPAEVKAIDVGAARLCSRKLDSWIGHFEPTPLRESLVRTIQSITQANHE
jgi:nucleoside-diphosphate-sugar epimerase